MFVVYQKSKLQDVFDVLLELLPMKRIHRHRTHPLR